MCPSVLFDWVFNYYLTLFICLHFFPWFGAQEGFGFCCYFFQFVSWNFDFRTMGTNWTIGGSFWTLFYSESGWTWAQITQEGCEFSILEDIKTFWAAVSRGLCLSKRVGQDGRGLFEPQWFYDSVKYSSLFHTLFCEKFCSVDLS